MGRVHLQIHFTFLCSCLLCFGVTTTMFISVAISWWLPFSLVCSNIAVMTAPLLHSEPVREHIMIGKKRKFLHIYSPTSSNHTKFIYPTTVIIYHFSTKKFIWSPMGLLWYTPALSLVHFWMDMSGRGHRIAAVRLPLITVSCPPLVQWSQSLPQAIPCTNSSPARYSCCICSTNRVGILLTESWHP